MPVVLEETRDRITFQVTSELNQILLARKIFLRPPAYPNFEKITLLKNIQIEGYAHFPGSDFLHQNGSFSYSESNNINHNLKVGRYSSIAKGFKLFGERHPSEWATQSNFTYNLGYPAVAAAHADLLKERLPNYAVHNKGYMGATIGNDVWIGQDVQMAQNVTVGDGAIIAAGSIVTKDVLSYSMVGGVPARFIKKRFSEEVIQKLEAGRWWDIHPQQVFRFDIKSPELFAENILKLREKNEAIPYVPVVSTWNDFMAKQVSDLILKW